ncbi:hypothetical protein HDV00_010542 [Rhizophlyctis rosea]|nr:hypothetical protein HDV00_010542 [Rhizophlyctis rosea]
MQPDAGDLALLVEALIRTLPHLPTLTIRISKTLDGDYDFFAIPREYVERCLRRLEGRTRVGVVTLELAVRLWASRRSYVDELVGAFGGGEVGGGAGAEGGREGGMKIILSNDSSSKFLLVLPDTTSSMPTLSFDFSLLSRLLPTTPSSTNSRPLLPPAHPTHPIPRPLPGSYPQTTHTTLSLHPSATTYGPLFLGFGTSLAWWARIIGAWPSSHFNKIMEWIYAPPPLGLGLTVQRYNIGGGDDPHCRFGTHLRPGGDVPGWNRAEGDPVDGRFDEAQLRVLIAGMEYARQRNLTPIIEAFSNSPPYYLTRSGCVSGSEGHERGEGECNLPLSHVPAFVKYFLDVVERLQQYHNIPLWSINPMNESSIGGGSRWSAGGMQEGCDLSCEVQEEVLRCTVGEIERRGGMQGVKVVVGDDLTPVQTLSTAVCMNPDVRSAATQINTHTYGTSPASQHALSSFSASTSTPLWMSEVGIGGSVPHSHTHMSPAIDLALAITRDLNSLQCTAWCYWQVLENEHWMRAGAGNWGLIHVGFDSGDWGVGDMDTEWRTKKYFVMMQFAFLQQGGRVLKLPAGRGVGFVGGARVVYVLVNDGFEGGRDVVRLEGVRRGEMEGAGLGVRVWRTSEGEDCREVGVGRGGEIEVFGAEGDGGVMEVSVWSPAMSVTTVVVEGVRSAFGEEEGDVVVGGGDISASSSSSPPQHDNQAITPSPTPTTTQPTFTTTHAYTLLNLHTNTTLSHTLSDSNTLHLRPTSQTARDAEWVITTLQFPEPSSPSSSSEESWELVPQPTSTETTPQPLDDQPYYIFNRSTTRVLDLQGLLLPSPLSTISTFSNPGTWQLNFGTNQRWALLPASSIPPPAHPPTSSPSLLTKLTSLFTRAEETAEEIDEEGCYFIRSCQSGLYLASGEDGEGVVQMRSGGGGEGRRRCLWRVGRVY